MGEVYDDYLRYIKTILNDKKEKWRFKSNSNYTRILEHVSFATGQEYLNVIIKKFNNLFLREKKRLIELCKLNDSYGQPNKFVYANFTTCSPTNLRYILHSLLILHHIQKKKMNQVDIIEIGGGYGGLYVFIKNLAPLFNISLNTYTIFDLLEASKLQKKYLQGLGYPDVNCCQIDNFKNLKADSFLISNYAFSEIPLKLQKEYTENIINPFISHGFLTWNYIPVYKFIENVEIESINEYPRTGNNYYVYF